jgi:hypothetical protein
MTVTDALLGVAVLIIALLVQEVFRYTRLLALSVETLDSKVERMAISLLADAGLEKACTKAAFVTGKVCVGSANDKGHTVVQWKEETG